MIQINLVVPNEEEINFDSKKIIAEYNKSGINKNKVIILEVDEEEFVYLRLKFGKENVWKR